MAARDRGTDVRASGLVPVSRYAPLLCDQVDLAPAHFPDLDLPRGRQDREPQCVCGRGLRQPRIQCGYLGEGQVRRGARSSASHGAARAQGCRAVQPGSTLAARSLSPWRSRNTRSRNERT